MSPMPERAKLLTVPFSTADAEQPSFSFDSNSVLVRFKDWREQIQTVQFTKVIGVRWQGAGSKGPQDRDDCSYEILDSDWLAEHIHQRVVEPTEGHHHYRLCFNAAGVLDVLAVEIRAVATEPKS